MKRMVAAVVFVFCSGSTKYALYAKLKIKCKFENAVAEKR